MHEKPGVLHTRPRSIVSAHLQNHNSHLHSPCTCLPQARRERPSARVPVAHAAPAMRATGALRQYAQGTSAPGSPRQAGRQVRLLCWPALPTHAEPRGALIDGLPPAPVAPRGPHKPLALARSRAFPGPGEPPLQRPVRQRRCLERPHASPHALHGACYITRAAGRRSSSAPVPCWQRHGQQAACAWLARPPRAQAVRAMPMARRYHS